MVDPSPKTVHVQESVAAPIFDLIIEQGATFQETFNWYGGGKVMAAIELITVAYPAVITVTGHGLPTSSDTPMIISGVVGMEALNSTELGIEEAARIDANTFSIPVSTLGKIWTVGTGEITWYRPSVITTYTARMYIRKNWHTNIILVELTTENSGLILDANDASIQINITATATAALANNFVGGVYDIELISPAGIITRVVQGKITLSKEISRPNT